MSTVRKIEREPAVADDAAVATAMKRLEPLLCDAVNMLRVALSIQNDCFRQAEPAGGGQWLDLKISREERESVDFSTNHALDVALKLKREFYRACDGEDPHTSY